MSRFATASGKRGSGRQFTDAAIQFCLTCIFHSNQPLSPAQTRPTISEVNRHLLRQLSIAAVIDLAELTDCIQPEAVRRLQFQLVRIAGSCQL
mgnify:CR=1 FL=1